MLVYLFIIYMKIFKLGISKFLKTRDIYYSIFKFEKINVNYSIRLGNFIRCYLLTNIFCLRVSNILIFVKKKNSPTLNSKFKVLNEFFPIEELRENINLILNNCKKIIFYNSYNLVDCTTGLMLVHSSSSFSLTSKDIFFVNQKINFSTDNYICKILNSNVDIKFFVKLNL